MEKTKREPKAMEKPMNNEWTDRFPDTSYEATKFFDPHFQFQRLPFNLFSATLIPSVCIVYFFLLILFFSV